jgi:DNA-binding IclR family transcriptional regulator
MERLSATTGAGCLALIKHGDDSIVVAASTRQSRRRVAPTRVGQRLPFVPPLGSLFVAWASPEEQELWLARATDEAQRALSREALQRIRSRGTTLTRASSAASSLEAELSRLQAEPELRSSIRQLLTQATPDYDPESLHDEDTIRAVGAPVFDSFGQVALVLVLFGLPPGTRHDSLSALMTELIQATSQLSSELTTHSTIDAGRDDA